MRGSEGENRELNLRVVLGADEPSTKQNYCCAKYPNRKAEFQSSRGKV